MGSSGAEEDLIENKKLLLYNNIKCVVVIWNEGNLEPHIDLNMHVLGLLSYSRYYRGSCNT